MRWVVTVLVLASLLFGVKSCRDRDAAIAAAAVWKLQAHALDSTLAVQDSLYLVALQRTDTVRETVTRLVVRYAVDTLWRADTVTVNGEQRLAVPLPTIARADSTVKACSLLAVRCAEERVAAEAKAATLTREVALLKARPEKSCRGAFLSGAALGAGAGGVIGFSIHP